VVHELLFESYGAPSVCAGVDAMFSYYYNTMALAGAGGAATHVPPGVVVSAGHTTTTMLTWLPGAERPDPASLRRCVLRSPTHPGERVSVHMWIMSLCAAWMQVYAPVILHVRFPLFVDAQGDALSLARSVAFGLLNVVKRGRGAM
jgi:hypothetical protein